MLLLVVVVVMAVALLLMLLVIAVVVQPHREPMPSRRMGRKSSCHHRMLMQLQLQAMVPLQAWVKTAIVQQQQLLQKPACRVPCLLQCRHLEQQQQQQSWHQATGG